MATLVDQVDALPARARESPSLAIANGIAQRYKRHTGQGPTNTRTTITADLVICLDHPRLAACAAIAEGRR